MGMDAGVRHIPGLENRRRVFQDRFEAGEVLGEMLRGDLPRLKDGLVLAIPAGGVPVGLRVNEAEKKRVQAELARGR